MRRLLGVLICFLILVRFGAAAATPLVGGVNFFDPSGVSIFGVPQPISGDLNAAGNTMTVDPFSFFGFSWVTQSVELLGPGSYTRPDGVGGNIATTVGPGQLGAYMVFNWNINTIPNFMVWDVVSRPTGSSYTTVDSDGDGIRGQAFLVGPFVGFSVVYDFTVGEPPPGISVSINVDGGTQQECSETGGSHVALTATTELSGGAGQGLIEWFVDGESAGTGATVTPFLFLGSHNIEVQASTTTGETASDTVGVSIQDRTPPTLELGFLDRHGNPVTSIEPGDFVTTHIVASDICDPEPVAEGTAVPVFSVEDGDRIMVKGGRLNAVKLPTTAVELSATARDASGNTATGMAVLSIED